MFWIMLPILAGAEGTQAADQPVVPNKDADVNKLLVQQTSATTKEQAQAARKLLSEMSAGRRQSALAYALLWHETRTAALEYLMDAPPEAPLMPFVFDAAKWGKGRDQLLVVRILTNNPDKRVIPVLLEFAFDMPYQEWHNEGDLHNIIDADLFMEAAMLLHSLTDGAIGLSGKAEARRKWFLGIPTDRQRYNIR